MKVSIPQWAKFVAVHLIVITISIIGIITGSNIARTSITADPPELGERLLALESIEKSAFAPVPASVITPTPSPAAGPSAIAAATPKSSSTPLPATPAPAGKGAYGIVVSLANLSPAELASTLDNIKSMGITWVRFDIEWSNIESDGPGQYNWTDYDRAAAAVQARGLKALGIIDYTPAWARSSKCSATPMCPTADPAAFGKFAGIAAAHYKSMNIHTWEVWNEPNIPTFYASGADPATYTAMLKASYQAIKSADPSAFVLSAGLSPAGTNGSSMSPPDFLKGIYNNGGKGYFDAVAHHPYTYPFSPAFADSQNAWGQLSTLHDIMVAHGDSGKQIWVTEYGAPTGGPDGIATTGLSYNEGGADHVTEALQATIVRDAIAQISKLPYVGPFFWYTYKDSGTSTDTVENFFGFLRADGSAKPAYSAFTSAIK